MHNGIYLKILLLSVSLKEVFKVSTIKPRFQLHILCYSCQFIWYLIPRYNTTTRDPLETYFFVYNLVGSIFLEYNNNNKWWWFIWQKSFQRCSGVSLCTNVPIWYILTYVEGSKAASIAINSVLRLVWWYSHLTNGN